MKIFLEKLEKFVFYLLVFCLPFQIRHIFFVWGKSFNEWQGIYFYTTDILVLALLVLWGWRLFCHSGLDPESRSRNKFGMTDKALLVFLFFSALSLFAAPNFWLGFYSFLKLVEFALLFLYLEHNFSRFFDAHKLWLVFGASALFQGLVAIAQFFKQGSLGLKFLAESPLGPEISGVAKIVLDGEKMIRAYGTLPHPNILAAILMTAIFGLGYIFLKNYYLCHSGLDPESRNSGSRIKCGMTEGGELIVFSFILFLLIFALFLTFSRAILILGFLFFIFWLVFLRCDSKLRRPVRTLISLFVISFLLLVFCFWPFLSARFSDLKSGDQAVDLRIFYSQAAADFLARSPVLGVGQGNFVYVLSQKFPDFPTWQFQPVHNIYLLVAAETGILGLLAFLAFLFFTLKSAWPRRNNLFVSSLLFIVNCLLLIGLTDHFLWDLQQGQLLFWIFLGILAGAHSSTDPALKNKSS